MHDSLIFVVLVGAWLVVLVPMLARHRQEVRRTADAALATRVLHRGDSGVRLSLRRGPAAGHPGDPGWQDETADDRTDLEEDLVDDDSTTEHELDHDEHELDHDEHDEYEHAEDGPAVRRPGRGGFDPQADAVARRARYAFRQRVTLTLLIAAVVTLLGGLVGVSLLWWPHLLVDLALVGYLGYLRRQTRIEADVRERRLSRMSRARLGVDVADERDDHGGHVPRRLRRPGAVVLEIDDEDPAFDELDAPAAPAEMDLPRASGQ